MKFFLVALVAAALSTVDASANFKNTVNTVNNQMSSLTASLAQLKATADRLGHSHISNKCSEASQYVGNAQFAWGGMGNIFVLISTSTFLPTLEISARTIHVKLDARKCGNGHHLLVMDPSPVNILPPVAIVAIMHRAYVLMSKRPLALSLPTPADMNALTLKPKSLHAEDASH